MFVSYECGRQVDSMGRKELLVSRGGRRKRYKYLGYRPASVGGLWGSKKGGYGSGVAWSCSYET
jgi:hypothetical protein